VQADAVGDEALKDNIDHNDAREQPLPVLQRFTRGCQPLRRLTLRNVSCSLIQVNERAIMRYTIARKNRND